MRSTMQRKSFTAEFKAKVALEALRSEKGSGWVAQGGCPPQAPVDPDVRD